MHWCALCQEHREMKGRLSDDAAIMPITIVNPPSLQEMNSADNNPDSASSVKGSGGKTIEMQAL